MTKCAKWLVYANTVTHAHTVATVGVRVHLPNLQISNSAHLRWCLMESVIKKNAPVHHETE